MPDKIPMTPSGHVALTEEYRFRTSEERPRIVRDIAELYSGTILLGESPKGGLRATLTLPAVTG